VKRLSTGACRLTGIIKLVFWPETPGNVTILPMDRKAQSAWFVYMLRCSDRSLYTGITTDLTKRLKHHNEGMGARYTRSRLPVELVYQEDAVDRSAAQRREAQIKALSADAKRKMITG